MPYISKPFRVSRPTPAYAFLMDVLGLGMKEAQRYVDRGRLYQEGVVITEKNQRIVGSVEVVVYEPHSQGLAPCFEEEDFALFDKPSGLLVHPTSRKTSYSLHDEILHYFGDQAKIVHRLDRETSGLILVAKHKKAEVALKQCFEKRQVDKTYLALVRGHMKTPLHVDAPLLNNQEYGDIKLRMVVDEAGKPSQTEFEPLCYFPDIDATLVKATPHTGRQHQIRVHLFHVKHPILGDPLYGVPTWVSERYLDEVLLEEERLQWMGAKRLLLHANTLAFSLEGKQYAFTSPQETQALFYALGKEKNAYNFV